MKLNPSCRSYSNKSNQSFNLVREGSIVSVYQVSGQGFVRMSRDDHGSVSSAKRFMNSPKL